MITKVLSRRKVEGLRFSLEMWMVMKEVEFVLSEFRERGDFFIHWFTRWRQ